MRGFWLGLSLSVAFILGCVSAPMIVPQTRAQQEATRWVYLCFGAEAATEVQERANEVGARGWEMHPGPRRPWTALRRCPGRGGFHSMRGVAA